jgi:hypothetical protein
MLTLVVVTALVLGGVTAWAADDTTGKVSIESTSVGAGVGFTWGDGTLEYRGERYPFTITGLSIGDVGVAKVFAKGEVYNLKRVEDFAGVFMAAVAAATLGGGAGAAAMQNQNDVSMVWTATSQGLSFSLAQAGVSVKLHEDARYEAAKGRKDRPAEDAPAAAPRPSR